MVRACRLEIVVLVAIEVERRARRISSGLPVVSPGVNSDLPRAFRTADYGLIHAADCCSRYSLWTCCGVRY